MYINLKNSELLNFNKYLMFMDFLYENINFILIFRELNIIYNLITAFTLYLA